MTPYKFGDKVTHKKYGLQCIFLRYDTSLHSAVGLENGTATSVLTANIRRGWRKP